MRKVTVLFQLKANNDHTFLLEKQSEKADWAKLRLEYVKNEDVIG